MAEYEFFIGRKATLAYVGVIIAQIVPSNQEFVIKARGKAISKAIDVALISCRKLKTIKIKNIKVDSEEIRNTKKEIISLSTIEILLGE